MNHQPADNVSRATITSLLSEARAGNAQASADLLPLVYEQLRTMAARKMRQERAGQTLQATALVHEAYLRLVGDSGTGRQWDGSWHFFAAAAEAMRRILVDGARSRGRLKRGGGGGGQRVDLEAMELT